MHDSALLIEVCEELLQAGRRARFRVEGASMEPAIQEGDTVEVAQLRGAEARRGMVVMYRGPHGPLVHRVVGRRAGGLILRGDAAAAPDPLVSPEQVVGLVVRIEAGGTGTARWPVPAGVAIARGWLRGLRRAASRATLFQRMSRDRS